jgi:nucleoside 2-deoxyribosyltransferase
MKIYLAGPYVFRPDAPVWAESARRLLAAVGHRALIPLDNDETTAAGIYRANIALIGEADAVLANLEPFRGREPDSGTCFEIGYAVALGKPVVGYLSDGRAQADKLAEHYGGRQRRPDGRLSDPQGLAVEDFALPVNLMLGVSCRIVEGDLGRALLELTG